MNKAKTHSFIHAEKCTIYTFVFNLISQFFFSMGNSFELNGCLGGIFGMLNKKGVVEGTEGGLANMVKLSEEAQKAK